MMNRGPAHRLTLRGRVALWTAGAVFISNAILVVFINSAALLLLRSIKAPPPYGIPPETSHVLAQVRLESLLGLGLMTVFGWAGARWLASRALRPLRQVSEASLGIDTDTLDTRLVLRGAPDELKELADRFDAMLDRLQAAFVREHEFAADASHELRTPLAVARANLEVVHLDPSSTLHDYREMANSIEATLVRLERLASDLLILASSDATPTCEDVLLAPLIEDILVDLRPVAATHGITVSSPSTEQLIVVGDAGLLQRAFQNLIENAIHYNRAGGAVTIRMRRHDTGAVVEIADTGVGISPADLSSIFDRFYRVDRSRSRHRGGAGLGLALTQEIVRRHGGDITVESRLDAGTTFTIYLPA